MKKIKNSADLSRSQRKVLDTFSETGIACVDAIKKNNRYYYPSLKNLSANGLVYLIQDAQFALTYDGQKIVGEMKADEEFWNKCAFELDRIQKGFNLF